MQGVRPLILVVEDDQASAEALLLILSDWGAEVIHASCHSTATSAASARLSDIRFIITDYDLGSGGNGLSLAQWVGAAAPHARVLIISGSFDPKVVETARGAGCDVMQKPVRAEAILNWLEEA